MTKKLWHRLNNDKLLSSLLDDERTMTSDSELEIAVGHWLFLTNFSHLAEQVLFARPYLLYISNGEAIDSL